MALPLRIEPVEYSRTWDTPRPPVRLQLIVGGQSSGHRRLDHSVYRRRRIAAAVALVVVVMFGSLLIRAINSTGNAVLQTMPASAQQLPSAVPDDAPGTLRGQAVIPGGIYVAQRGDTMWVIARALKPTGDLSGTIRKLVRLNGGPSLEIGQRVLLPK